MGLVFEKNVSFETQIAIWKIEEEPDFFSSSIDFSEYDFMEYESIKHPFKRMQWLASRYLLKKISNENRLLLLYKNENGKPFFENANYHFSITHSHSYVAVIISKEKNVSIDLEKITEKVLKVKHKFLHTLDFEQGENLEKLTLIWSAKETLYKYFDSKLLHFKEHLIIKKCEDNAMESEVLIADEKVGQKIGFMRFEDFVMTYIF
jgi:4'-phosphopantetheinyl transferase EntD